jgi:PilZ domain/Gram-negative bacterial TonB protein C-terminal
MSTAATRALQNLQSAYPPRLGARRHLAVPLSVTVLRSGVPDDVPGRSIDLCAGGMGAVLAAELVPGELVGVEFQLPHAGPVLAKARVCYHQRLRYGLQFLAIPSEQRAMIDYWARESQQPSQPRVTAATVRPAAVREERLPNTPAPPVFARRAAKAQKIPAVRYQRRKILMLLIASVIVAAGMGWWRWEQAWQELEGHLPGHNAVALQPRAKVPADVMQRLLVHRADPIAPVGTKITGDVVLDAVIGRNGAVISLTRVSGPDVLTRAAMDSVQWWKYDPYQLNGEPAEVETTVTVEFR